MTPRPSLALRTAVLLGDGAAVLAAFVVALQVRAALNGLLEAAWPALATWLKPFGAPSHAHLLPLVLLAWAPLVAWRVPVTADPRALSRAIGRVAVEATALLGALLFATGAADTTSRAFVAVLAGSGAMALLGWRAAVVGALAAEHEADPGRLVADRAVKRVGDVVGALAGLVLAAPVIALAALAIKLHDGGPVLFVQERCGRYGRPFRMLKLRTMVVGAQARLHAVRALDDTDGPVFKSFADPRVTPVGAFLRRWSLDELPQFWNVVRGEMSLVGPRPALPDEVAGYARWHLRRLAAQPGLTGTWQVSGRSLLDFATWMRMDREYVLGWSLRRDAWLILRTVPAVLGGRGAA